MAVTTRILWDARLVEMIEDAFENIGVDPSEITERQLNSALRAIRLQLISWSGKLQQAWSVETQEYTLSTGQVFLPLPVGALAISEATYRDPQGLDTPVSLMSREDYMRIPDKTIIGDRPTQIWVDKKHNVGGARQLNAYLWQRPRHNDSQLILGLIMTAQDSSQPRDVPEVPQTWFDALVDAISWRLARKYNPALKRELQADARVSEQIAMGSTEERAPFRMVFETRKRSTR